MLTILVLLMIAWVCVGAQFVIQRRREGKADSSVASFRQQLSTLERATPGSTMRHSVTGPVPMIKLEAAPARPARQSISMRRRRRDVLFGLAGLTVFSLLLRLAVAGTFTTLLLLLSVTALGTYIWALRRLHVAAMARTASMRVTAVPDNVASIDSAPSNVPAYAGGHVGPVSGTTVLPTRSAAAN